MIEEQARVLDEGKKAIAELIMVIDMLKRRLIIYKNPHAPPSHGSAPAQQKKARSAEERTVRADREPKRPEHRAASPVIPASPATEDQRRWYITSQANMLDAAAPPSRMYAPLPSR